MSSPDAPVRWPPGRRPLPAHISQSAAVGTPVDGGEAQSGRGARWISWLLGAALLVSVVTAATHVPEERGFLDLAQGAKPWWLLIALVLQAGTYAAQGGIWRRVARASGGDLSPRAAFEFSLAKVFVDQALPSAGLSSSVFIAKALRERGIPPGAVKAAVAINIASYHLAYVAALGAALVFLGSYGLGNRVVVLASVLFLVFATGLAAGVMALAGAGSDRITDRLPRLPSLQRVVGYVSGADRSLIRNPRLLASASALQLAIVLLDAATIWSLIRGLGAMAPFGGVYASFMLASLFRTVGIVPGGLGTFEATSVLTLHMTGLDVSVALSATLLFRMLSFWAPMAPGYWCSRLAVKPRGLTASTSPHPGIDYWTRTADELLAQLASRAEGLSSADAGERLRTHGPNVLSETGSLSRMAVFLRQCRSPLLLLLLFAAVASSLSGAWPDATIVVLIVVATVAIGYSREYSAEAAAAALGARVRVRTQVLRDGRPVLVPVEQVVPGDVVLLSAGSLVPADSVVLTATDCFVSEAVLTGESFPVPKTPGTAAGAAALSERANCVFLGTNVRSGTARCLVVRTGPATQFGAIAHRLALRPPETEFDRGIRQFGYLLTAAMLTMVLVVFGVHVLRGRPPVETLLFAVALAVGLSPELLPAILSVNLARGAKLMARRGVLVRRLNAIENLGSTDILCTDKTGTLTEGVVRVDGAYDAAGEPSTEVMALAAQNAGFETGVTSALDEAILKACTPDLDAVRKVAEIPFDYQRKRVTVVVRAGTGVRLITKGAFQQVLDVCTRSSDGSELTAARASQLQQRYEGWSRQGIRVLAVAAASIEEKAAYERQDERELTFMGFVTFLDRPQAGVAEALAGLAHLGVTLKVITGDNRLVARHLATLVGMPVQRILTGPEMEALSDEALWHLAERVDLFAEVNPNQKERIILALKKMGHVVAFLGDGVNDAPAMHAADTSLSVEHAVDVAREAADFVLLERNLDVIRGGIEEGRKTFANTLKYLLITTSANLGNMVSMAAASLWLPFLPLTAGQILLNNFLSDVPALGLADDSVDRELVDRPRRWDLRFISRYMLQFGLVSSLFDLLTFAILLGVFHASRPLFQTAWFVESLLTELVIALVVRTQRPFFRSQPGTLLLSLTVVLVAVTLAIPYLPYVSVLGFVRLPAPVLVTVMLITAGYVAAAEVQKTWFYRARGEHTSTHPQPSPGHP